MSAGHRVRGVVVAAVILGGLPVAPPAARADPVGAVAANVVTRSLAVALELSTEEVDLGERFQAKVTVVNPGAEALRQVAVDLRLDTAGLLISGPRIKTISRIGPGRSSVVTWSVLARERGSYLVLARVTVDGVAFESTAQLMIVR